MRLSATAMPNCSMTAPSRSLSPIQTETKPSSKPNGRLQQPASGNPRFGFGLKLFRCFSKAYENVTVELTCSRVLNMQPRRDGDADDWGRHRLAPHTAESMYQ